MKEPGAGVSRSVHAGIIAAKVNDAPLVHRSQAPALRQRPTLRRRVGRRLLQIAKPFLLPLIHRYERILHASLERTAIGTIDNRLNAIADQLQGAQVAMEKLEAKLDRGLHAGMLPVEDGLFLVRQRFGLLFVRADDPILADACTRAEPHAVGIYQAISSLLRRNSTVVDLGAGTGLFTLFALDRIAPAGGVIAIERNPAAAVLRRTLHVNGVADRVEVHEREPGDMRPVTAVLPDPAAVSVVRITGDAAGFAALGELRQLAEANPRLAVLVEFKTGASETADDRLPERIAMMRALGFEPWRIDATAAALHPLHHKAATAALLLLRCPPTDFPGLTVA